MREIKLGNERQQLEEQLRASSARASTLESHLTVAQEEIKRRAQHSNLSPEILMCILDLRGRSMRV